MTGKEEMTVRNNKIALLLVLSVFIVTLSVLPAKALDTGFVYTNPDTGYSVYFDDEQDLLSDNPNEQTPEFFVSDTPDGFKNVAGLFLGRDMEHTVTQIDIEQY